MQNTKLILFDPVNQSISTADLKGSSSALKKWMAGQNIEEKLVLGAALPESNTLVEIFLLIHLWLTKIIGYYYFCSQIFYHPGGRHFEVFRLDQSDTCLVYELDFNIHNVHLVMNDRIILQSEESNQ